MWIGIPGSLAQKICRAPADARGDHVVAPLGTICIGIPIDLIRLGLHFGVTSAQICTVELEELGKPLPAGMTEQRIRPFPTPGRAIEKLAQGEKRRMLERLYFKYSDLCSFAHGLGQANLLKILFDKRSPHSTFVTDAEREDRFQRVVLGEAYLISFLSIAQSTSELTVLYPGEIDLAVSAATAWQQLSEASPIVWTWFSRKVRQVCEGGFRLRTM
jgi:hypothetical protein